MLVPPDRILQATATTTVVTSALATVESGTQASTYLAVFSVLGLIATLFRVFTTVSDRVDARINKALEIHDERDVERHEFLKRELSELRAEILAMRRP